MNRLTPRQLRKLKNYTIEEMAEKLKLSPNGYRDKELGKTKWYVDEANLFCKIVGVPYDDIVFTPIPPN